MFFNAGMVGARTFVHMFDPSHGTHGVKAAAMIFALSLASLAAVDGELGDESHLSVWECQHVFRCHTSSAG